MKRLVNWYILLLLCCGVNTSGFAQVTGAGVELGYNFTRHLNVRQDLDKKFARTVENLLSSPAVNLYMDYSLNDKWLLRGKSGIETKGFVGSASGMNFSQEAYKFRYASINVSINRKYGDNPNFSVYNYLGASTGYLYKKEVEVVSYWTQTAWDPDNASNFNDYDKFNFGFVAGLGFDFNNYLWLEMEYNRDLLAPLQSDNLKIYNLGYAIQIGVNVLKLIQNKASS